MRFVVYLYLPTPPTEAVPAFFEHIVAAGICVSHFGRNDPPKKWSGDAQAMAKFTLEQSESNKYVFVRDGKRGINLSVELFYDPRWGHSTVSFDGSTLSDVDAVAKSLIKELDPWLCIQGLSGAGKEQTWRLLHERNDCPSEIKTPVGVA